MFESIIGLDPTIKKSAESTGTAANDSFVTKPIDSETLASQFA